MDFVTQRELRNFKFKLFEDLVLMIDPYSKGSWVEKFKCFCRDIDIRSTGCYHDKLIYFDFLSFVTLGKGFLYVEPHEIKKFKETFVSLANCHVSRAISYMWDYVLGFDPFLDDHSKYIDEFGMDLEFFSTPKYKWMLEEMKRMLDKEVVHEMNIKNKYHWHVNEVLYGELTPEERLEVSQFRNPNFPKTTSPKSKRNPGEYAEAVVLKICRFLKKLQFPTYGNSPLFCTKNPKDFSFLDKEDTGLTRMSGNIMVCEPKDAVVIMNEDLYFDLSRYLNLSKVNLRFITVKTIPYGLIKIGSKHRYNKLLIDKNIKAKFMDENKKIEFLHRQFFDFFIRNDVPFMAIKISGIKDKISWD